MTYHTALSTPKSAISLQDLVSLSTDFIFKFKELKIFGNTIFLLSQRNIEGVAALLAGLHSGLRVAILDHRQGIDRLKHCVSQTSATWIVDREGLNVYNKLGRSEQGDEVFQLPDHTHFSEHGIPRSRTQSASLSLEDINGEVVLFTSGSTGTPKGVIIGNKDLIQRISTERNWFQLDTGDNTLGVLPLSFDVGLTQLLGTLYASAHHVLGQSWLPVDILNTIAEQKITGLALSPVVWKTLLKFSDKERLWHTLNLLRYITLSGGDLDPSSLATITHNLNGPVFYKTYGQSEFFRIASFKTNLHPDKIRTVGKAYPGVTIRICDNDGVAVPTGSEGEIWAAGAGRMRGYTDQELLAENENDWHRTGDLGSVDEEGFLSIAGRKDEMIKILDQRVFPAEIAHSIDSILGVNGSEVVVIEHNEEYVIIAFVCLDQPDASEAELMRKLKMGLSRHMVPKNLCLIDSWPMTLSGKVDKISLKKTARSLLS